jgi:hypothetical protein
MKKLAFSLLSLCAMANAYQVRAQIPAGTKLVGGNIGYNRGTYSVHDQRYPIGQQTYENKSNRFNINPNVGVFLADNLAVGITASYSSSKQTSPYYEGPAPDLYSQVSKGYSVSAAPFLRYYYLPTETFGLYGQLSAGYSYQRGRTNYSSANRLSDKSSGYSVFSNITPALVFFPIAKLGLELTFGSIGYGSGSSQSDNPVSGQPNRKETQSGFGANFGFNNLALGASYYLGR